MAGHSHWASIKRKKGAVDAKKGKVFSKLARNITVAAREGGSDPTMNIKLQYAIEKAKGANMPKDNIERAIQKGTGAGGGEDLQHSLYEGYGPHGVAIMVEVLTDNKNRTTSEIRNIFERYGGSLGSSGCVSWIFEKRGMLVVDSKKVEEDRLMMVALEAGAEDVLKVEHVYQVICLPTELEKVKKFLKEQGIPPESSEISWLPKNFVDLDAETGKRVVELLEALEDHEDVQEVYANFNLPKDLLVEMQERR
ncbi:MAG TPA: YebC/PmpR family DNA-binding transcriptional regulator [Candidatus Hypogeohydataceae bacterium YC38]|nr:YebC/PmpR family DNA-binding transcriptional regulator [Candidatus Brocadiales bacterium]